MQGNAAERRSPGKAVGNSSEEVAARKRRITELRAHFMGAGMDDRSIAGRVAPELGVKPATVLTEIRKRVKGGRLPENPHNPDKGKLLKARVTEAERDAPVAEGTAKQAQPTEKSRADGLIEKMSSQSALFEDALAQIRARLGKPG